MLKIIPELDEYILEHVSRNLGCSLNSITCNTLSAKNWANNRKDWPDKKKDIVPYVDRLVQLGGLIQLERKIPGQDSHVGYYPGGTTFQVYP